MSENIYLYDTEDIDLKETSKVTLQACKQFDDIILSFNIFNDSIPIDLTQYSVDLRVLRSDNTFVIQDTGVTKSTNNVRIECIRDITRVYGKTRCELRLVNSSSKQKTSFDFIIPIKPSVISENSVVSGNVVTATEELNKSIDIGNALDNTLKEDITIGTQLDIDLDEDIEVGTILKHSLIDKIAEGNYLDEVLETTTTNANNKKVELEGTISTANTSKTNLENTTITADAKKTELDTSIANAQDDINTINSAGNRTFTIPSTAWVGTEPNLSYILEHNLGGENLVVGVKDNDTKLSSVPDCKFIDSMKIELYSTTRRDVTVTINKNAYTGSDAEWVSQEVIDARKGEISLKSKIDGIDSQLAHNIQDINNIPARGLPKILNYPNGFSFPLSLRIKRNLGGKFEVLNFDIESLHPLSSNKAYYVATDGLDSNDGLTRETAFRSITKAITRTDVDVVYIAGGQYGRQQAYTQYFPDRDLKMKAYNNEKVIIGCFEQGGLVWTLHATGTYKTARAATVGVYDTKILNSYGNYSAYTKKTTIADVVATSGSWFLDTDNQLYIHTLDDRKPLSDTDIKVALSAWTIKGDKNRSYYFEGIEFQFGEAALEIANAKQVLAKNCGFNYAQFKNGLNINNTDMTITQNCISFENYADAFNYHADNWSTKHLYFLEIDNVGYRNGWLNAPVSNNNGSTSHVNCIGIRVNGLYFENNGPNVADVGTRNLTWDIGCVAYDSRYIGVGFTGIDFLTENKKWLEGCIAYNSDISIYEGTTVGELHTRDCILKKVSSGTVISY